MTKLEKHQQYIKLLKEYNEHTNIYSKKAYDHLDFHLNDSIELATLIENKEQTIFDFGSGSGLPSIPIAIQNPASTIYAIESKSRKTKWLTLAKTELKLDNLHIITSNLFEWKAPTKPNIITAKAFGSPEKIITIRKRFNPTATIYIPISEKQITEGICNKNDRTLIQTNNHNFLKIN